jgi:DNA-binding NarL/FixJ family response regulator
MTTDVVTQAPAPTLFTAMAERGGSVVVVSDDARRAARMVAELDAGGLTGARCAPITGWRGATVGSGATAVVLFDGYPDAPTLATIADATASDHRLAVLVLGPITPEIDALVALASGASGYLPADAPGAAVERAVRALRAGEVVLSPPISRALVRGLRSGTGVVVAREDGRPIALTHREWDVLVLLRQGRTTAEIARRFVVSQGTVRTHVAAVLRKLGAAGRASLSGDRAAGG